jgi:hypothetical protein
MVGLTHQTTRITRDCCGLVNEMGNFLFSSLEEFKENSRRTVLALIYSYCIAFGLKARNKINVIYNWVFASIIFFAYFMFTSVEYHFHNLLWKNIHHYLSLLHAPHFSLKFV